MRRILIGVIVFCMVFACIPARISNAGDETGNSVFKKVWETDPVDNIGFTPAIDKDGNAWGLNMVPKNPENSNLVKLVDGKVAWTSKEEYLLADSLFSPSVMFHDNLVIASGVGMDFNDAGLVMTVDFHCYTLDGELRWERVLTAENSFITYQYFKGDIWLACKNNFQIIDPATGKDVKTITIPQTGKTSTKRLLKGFGGDSLDINMFFVFDDMIVLNNLDIVRAMKVSDELEPSLVWQKTVPTGDFLYLMNLMLWMSANPSIFLSCESESLVKCFDTKTGNEKWSMEGDLLSLALLKYNDKYILKSTLDAIECFDASNNTLLWRSNKLYFTSTFNDQYIFAYDLVDLDSATRMTVLDIKTGEVVTEIDFDGFPSVTVFGNSFYVTHNGKLAKYSMETN